MIKRVDDLMTYWIRKCEHIHESKHNRDKWRYFCIFVYFCLFWLFAIAGLLFVFGGLQYDNNSPDQYSINDWYNKMNRIFWIIGLVLFTSATIIGLILSVVLPKIYKDSRANYFASNDFKQKRLKWMKKDLRRYSKHDLKWLKKLNFIDQIKYDQTLSLKLKRKTNKK
ncbi:MAG: hypothetical protein L3I91_02255 [Mycoplasma sp.]